jgi:hypothetical protein
MKKLLVLMIFIFPSSFAEDRNGISECGVTYLDLVGTWYGERQLKNGLTQRWVMQRHENNSYESEVEMYTPAGKLFAKDNTSGLWWFENCQYKTLMNKSEKTTKKIENYYQVISLVENQLRYQSVDGKTVYLIKRVEDGFKL